MFLLLLFILRVFYTNIVLNVGAYFFMDFNWQEELLSSSSRKAVCETGTSIEQKYNQNSLCSGFIFSLNSIL